MMAALTWNPCSVPTDNPAQGRERPHTPQINLVGGVNFSTWADLKWSRANTHLAALQAKFGEWHASAPVSVESVLREDRQGIDLVARVPRGIPKHEWSLGLGDALHNLRSAFDAVAWGMAHFDGAKPTRPKRVSFPICEDEKQWNEAVRSWVGELSPEFQNRLKLMQPYTYAPGKVTVLSMLHELDIQDKHRDILSVSADLHAINLGGSYAYEDPAVQAVPRVEMYPNIQFADGVVLGSIHAGAEIRMLGQMILRPTIRAQLTYQDSTYEVVPTLQQFVVETRRHLDILMNGLASDDSNAVGVAKPAAPPQLNSGKEGAQFQRADRGIGRSLVPAEPSTRPRRSRVGGGELRGQRVQSLVVLACSCTTVVRRSTPALSPSGRRLIREGTRRRCC
jgi:hypothetical protein